MSKSPIRAGGCVVLARDDGHTQVALVHRPKYNDWSLPKGKAEADEALHVTAIREVAEETGLAVRLGPSLGTVSYPVGGRDKEVSWWLAHPLGSPEMTPVSPGRLGEIDQREWVEVEEALTLLTYEDDRDVLVSALALPPSVPLLVVRHAKALDRSDWTGPDYLRKISEKGRRQAQALADTLAAYGVEHLVSSSSTRCMETLRPYSQLRGLRIDPVREFSEESAAEDPDRVGARMRRLADDVIATGRPMAVCGHRPVLPLMFDALGVTPQAMKPAQIRVVFWDGTGATSTERICSPE